MSLLAKPIQPRQRFHSLATGLPDVDGNKGRFDLPFNVFSTYDPHDDVSDDELQLKNDKSDVEDFDEHEDKQAEKGSRFRRIVRSIILQNRWSKLRQMKVADEGLMTKLREMEDQTNGDILTFNPSSFRSASNTQQELSPQVKFIMCKPTWKRSSSELQIVYKAIDSLMVFKKFSPLIKQELTKVLHYETFGDGRIIIQQGHIGFSLYFVIKGSVAVEVTTTDKVTGKVFKQIVNEILAGGSFGEMALMNGMARSATVICVGQSEFLRIDKSDFHEVLMRSYKKEWERKMNFMNSSWIFRDWLAKELKVAGTTTVIKEYPPNKVIVQDLESHKGNIYLIMSGTCLAVSKISVVKEVLPYRKEKLRMELANESEAKLNRYQNREELFLVIRKLSYMDCFGVGEQLKDTSIVAQQKVEVLAVPTIHLLRHAKGNCLWQIRNAEMKKYPTLTEAFRHFLNYRQWKSFKNDLKQQIFLNKAFKSGPQFRNFSVNERPTINTRANESPKTFIRKNIINVTTNALLKTRKHKVGHSDVPT